MVRNQYELKRRTVYDIVKRGERTVRVISRHDKLSDAADVLKALDPKPPAKDPSADADKPTKSLATDAFK